MKLSPDQRRKLNTHLRQLLPDECQILGGNSVARVAVAKEQSAIPKVHLQA
jgi:hypothetical protein